jgi:hypothetical protein
MRVRFCTATVLATFAGLLFTTLGVHPLMFRDPPSLIVATVP